MISMLLYYHYRVVLAFRLYHHAKHDPLQVQKYWYKSTANMLYVLFYLCTYGDAQVYFMSI